MNYKPTILICLLLITVIFSLLTYNRMKDDTNNPADETTVKDIEGNVYKTITHGVQTWMAENLKTTLYHNTNPIKEVSDNTQWRTNTTGAQCNYYNDAANGSKYGKLNNFYAIADSRNIAPDGWHIATDADWFELRTWVAAQLDASGSLAKAFAAKSDWSPSTIADAIGNDLTKNNYSDFTALPDGYRWDYGEFDHIGDVGNWWSSTGTGMVGAFNWLLITDEIDIHRAGSVNGLGFSVRCVKDYLIH